MSRLLDIVGASVACTVLLATPVFADEWTAVQLRGRVLQLVDNQWQPLARGTAVPDGRLIRTSGGAHATFTRGQETVDLGPDTQIQIRDRGTAARPNTTVTQYFGAVSVEAQVENVQHFEVQTPYLAAVVKGTRFTVVSGKTGASVSVQRGHVEVDDHHNKSHTLITVGQSATVDRVTTDDAIAVSGSGVLPAVVAESEPLAVDDNGASPDTSGKNHSGDHKAAKARGDSGDNSGSGDSGSGNSANGSGNSGSGGGKGNGNSQG